MSGKRAKKVRKMVRQYTQKNIDESIMQVMKAMVLMPFRNRMIMVFKIVFKVPMYSAVPQKGVSRIDTDKQNKKIKRIVWFRVIYGFMLIIIFIVGLIALGWVGSINYGS